MNRWFPLSAAAAVLVAAAGAVLAFATGSAAPGAVLGTVSAAAGILALVALAVGLDAHRKAEDSGRESLRAVREECEAAGKAQEARIATLESELVEARASAASAQTMQKALTRAVSLLRETAPIVAGLSEAAIEKSRNGSTSLTDSIYALGEQSTRLSTTISSFLRDLSEGDESLEHNVRELDEDVVRLGEIAALYEQTNSSLDTSISQISESVATNVKLLDQVSDIAEQTSVLAINAAIYAAKAGEFGRGFSVIASEIQKLAQTAKSVAESVGSNTRGIEGQVEEFGTQHRRMMLDSQTSLREIIASIERTTTGLRPQMDRISDSVQVAAETSRDVTNRLNGINMTLQQHDAIQQMITHISDILGDALGTAPNGAELSIAEDEQIRDEARRIAARRFTMKDEFDAVGASGYEVEEGKHTVLEDGTELAGDVTLF
jgi:methyl-accepting chemotaxis protein